MRLRATHQMKFVVKPPSRATIRTGKFWKSGLAPLWTAASAMGLPAAKAKAMHELMIPANTATQAPLTKLNSAMEAFFSASESSFSFLIPARPQMAMPARQTRMPRMTIRPEVVATSPAMRPSKTGGTSVPKTAQKPSDRAMPSESPR